MIAGTCLIAGTYGLVRLAYGLFLPDIQASLQMSNAVAGLVSSGASAMYCVGATAGLLAAHRARALVGAALMTAAAGSVGMAVAPGLGLFAPSAIVASAGAGIASPALVAVVGRNIGAARRDRAQAVVNSGTGPGLVAAGLMALVLLPDWRLGFALSAAFTAAAGLGVLHLDRHHADGPERTPRRARGRVGDGLGWLLALRRPAVGAVLLGAASATVWTYGRALLVDTGQDGSASIVAWTAIGVGGAATVLTADALTGLSAQRAWASTTAVTAAATAALGTIPGTLSAIVSCALFGWAFVAATSALIAWAAALVPSRAAGGTSALFIALTFGQAIGAAVAGRLSESVGLPSTFLVAAVVTVVAGTCGWRGPTADRPV